MELRDIVILGAGGHAREVAFLIEEINRVAPIWRILGFVELDKKRVGTPAGKYSIVFSEDELLNKEISVAMGIGTPAIVHNIAERLKRYPNLTFPNLVHPSTIWDQERIVMGQGNVVCAGNIFTTDLCIGSFNTFNRSCTYGHDIVIGDYCVFNPMVTLSGGVKVGNGCLVGTGATILQYLSIGDYATIGAGAVVTKNVPSETTVVGVPARLFTPES